MANFFRPPLHKRKLNFHVLAEDLQKIVNFKFKIQANCNDHVKFHRDLLVRNTSKFNMKIYFLGSYVFFGSHLIFEIHIAQNWLILQKLRKNKNYRVSKSKIII